jgi:hypothetical protein
MELYCTPKVNTLQLNSRKLFEHTYTSDPHGLGTLTPIEFFQQDLLWQSSNNHSNSCSHKASKHTRSIHRPAFGPLAHHNGTSSYSPSLTCTSPDDRMSSPSTVLTRVLLSQLHEKSVDNSLVSMELNYSLVTLLSDKYFIVALPANPNM